MFGSIIVDAGCIKQDFHEFRGYYRKHGELLRASDFNQRLYTRILEHHRNYGVGAAVPITPKHLRGEERVAKIIREFCNYLYNRCTSSFGHKKVYRERDGKSENLVRLLSPYPAHYMIEEFKTYCERNYGQQKLVSGQLVLRRHCLRESDLYMIFNTVVAGMLKNLSAIDTSAQRCGPDNFKFLKKLIDCFLLVIPAADDDLQDKVKDIMKLAKKVQVFLKGDFKNGDHVGKIEKEDIPICQPCEGNANPTRPVDPCCNHCPYFLMGKKDPRVINPQEGAMECGHIHTGCCEQCEDAQVLPFLIEGVINLAKDKGYEVCPLLQNQIQYFIRKYRQVISRMSI